MNSELFEKAISIKRELKRYTMLRNSLESWLKGTDFRITVELKVLSNSIIKQITNEHQKHILQDSSDEYDFILKVVDEKIKELEIQFENL